jgi:hypothetical protein
MSSATAEHVGSHKVAKARLLRQPKAPIVYKKKGEKKTNQRPKDDDEKNAAAAVVVTYKDGWIRDCFAFRMKNKDKLDEETQELKVSDQELIDAQVRIYDDNKNQLYDDNGNQGRKAPAPIRDIAWAIKWFFPVSKIRPPKGAIVPVMNLETGKPYRTATFGLSHIAELAPDQPATTILTCVLARIDEKTGSVTAEMVDHPSTALGLARVFGKTEESLRAWYAKHYHDYATAKSVLPVRTTQEIMDDLQKARREAEIKQMETAFGAKDQDRGMQIALRWQELMVQELGGQDKFEDWGNEILAKEAVTDRKLLMRQMMIRGLRVLRDKASIRDPRQLAEMSPEEKKNLQERLVKYAEQEGKSEEQVATVAKNAEQALAPETEEQKQLGVAHAAYMDYQRQEPGSIQKRDAADKAKDAIRSWVDYKLKEDFKSDPLKLQMWLTDVRVSTDVLHTIERQLVRFLDVVDKLEQVTRDPSLYIDHSSVRARVLAERETFQSPGVPLQGLKCDDCIFNEVETCTHLKTTETDISGAVVTPSSVPPATVESPSSVHE